jgi:predicted TIM-barrel fold metal-dependent hydrolase
MQYYSGDSHIVEHADCFAGLTERFGDSAPQIIRDHNGKPGDWYVLARGGIAIPVARLGIAGNRLDDPATQELIERGYEGLNPGVLDGDKRLAEQGQDGIVGEVMYPSLNMFTWAVGDTEIMNAAFQRHNDWIVHYCRNAPDRLIGIGCLPIPDVGLAIQEMTRAAELGVRGFMIPTHTPTDRPYHHEDYDPFWEAAQEMNLPLTMHIFVGTSPDGGMPSHWGTPGGTIKGYTMAFTTAVNAMIDIICGGVVERFPKLKFVIAEYEIGWLAHILERLDHAAYRTPQHAVDYLTMKPSEYFRRNFIATFEDDKFGIATRYGIGVKNLMWGNDYPHHDSIWPQSMRILDELMTGVPANEVQQMCLDTVCELYSVDRSKLPTA